MRLACRLRRICFAFAALPGHRLPARQAAWPRGLATAPTLPISPQRASLVLPLVWFALLLVWCRESRQRCSPRGAWTQLASAEARGQEGRTRKPAPASGRTPGGAAVAMSGARASASMRRLRPRAAAQARRWFAESHAESPLHREPRVRVLSGRLLPAVVLCQRPRAVGVFGVGEFLPAEQIPAAPEPVAHALASPSTRDRDGSSQQRGRFERRGGGGRRHRASVGGFADAQAARRCSGDK